MSHQYKDPGLERVISLTQERVGKQGKPLYQMIQGNFPDLLHSISLSNETPFHLVQITYQADHYHWHKKLEIATTPMHERFALHMYLSDNQRNHIHVAFPLSENRKTRSLAHDQIKVRIRTNPDLDSGALNTALMTLLNEWTKEPMDDVLVRCRTKISQTILTSSHPNETT